MNYVFDNGPLRVLALNFYEQRFPSLWEKFDSLVKIGRIFSVREVFNEIEKNDNNFVNWAKRRKSLFLDPTPEELVFVKEIFSIKHFQILISQRQILTGYPAADPFVIAAGKIKNATVVTTEKEKPNSSKMPTVCKHFDIKCIGLEEFMELEGWKF